MDPLQILERYFNTFITQDDPKHFFIGMADYLNYGDGVPEYDWITSEISAMPAALLSKFEEQKKVAFERVREKHKEITTAIREKNINLPAVENALVECKQIFDGHIYSETPGAYMLHLRLYDIIQALYQTPEYREFASQYITFSERDKTQPRQYLPIKELDELMKTKAEVERGAEDAIWGIQAHIYNLREVINRGREIGEGITERIQKREPGATLDMLNFGVLMGEWMKIEEGRPERDPVFFVPKKVRPQVQRFHMYVVAHFTEARAAINAAKPIEALKESVEIKPEVDSTVAKKPILLEEKGKGYIKFYKEGPRILIGKVSTKKHKLIKALIDPLGTAKNVNVVFDAIKDRKAASDIRLKDTYTAANRERELIDFTMKELQKIKGLKGRISLTYHHNNSTVLLNLG